MGRLLDGNKGGKGVPGRGKGLRKAGWEKGTRHAEEGRKDSVRIGAKAENRHCSFITNKKCL